MTEKPAEKPQLPLGPFIFTTSVLLELLGAIVLLSVIQNQGHLVYNIDDAYIHMAMAKNFSQFGVWGVTRYAFSSSTSSPLWTLVLALLYKVVGVHNSIPLFMNLLAAIGVIALVNWLLFKYCAPRWFSRYLLLAIVFLMPMPTLVTSGLEHVLHTVACIALIYLAAQMITTEQSPDAHFHGAQRQRLFIALLVTTMLSASIRYESMFVIFVVCLLFLLRKQIRNAILVGAAGAVPIVGYGLISISNGSLFFPNSVLLKGYKPDLSSISGLVTQLGLISFHQLSISPHLLVLVLGTLLLMFLQMRRLNIQTVAGLWTSSGVVMGIIFLGTTFLHLQFARLDWFFRYEAYLVVLGLTVIAILAAPLLPERFPVQLIRRPQSVILALLVFFLLLPTITRAISALRETPSAMHEIYSQDYQLGLFLNSYYQGQSVALHDIGAMNYLADIRDTDIFGIADVELTRRRLTNTYTTEGLDQLTQTRKVKIAVVYTIGYVLPANWIKVAEWKIDTWVVVGDPSVAFYAVDPTQAQSLTDNLKAFAPRLPSNVSVTYFSKS